MREGGVTAKPQNYDQYDVAEIAGEFVVLAWRDGQPDWRREIARFKNRDRAEDYAQVNNDVSTGEWEPMFADEAETAPVEVDGDTGVLGKGAALVALPAPEERPAKTEVAKPAEEFTPSKTDILKGMYAQGISAEFIAEAIGWSVHSVYNRITELGLSKREKKGVGRPWASQDEEFKKLWGEGVAAADIAEKLKRTIAAVYSRAKHLGLGEHPRSGRMSPRGTERRVSGERAPPLRTSDAIADCVKWLRAHCGRVEEVGNGTFRLEQAREPMTVELMVKFCNSRRVDCNLPAFLISEHDISVYEAAATRARADTRGGVA